MLHPEEIDNQQFEVSFRGYNTREVDEFLNKIRIDVEEMVKEQDALRRRIAAAELIAKEAKDHEEEFLASMRADKDLSQATLQSSKTEGERIIREAKNAAAGIMSEVRRRAGEISKEGKKASAEMADAAKKNAEAIVADAEKTASDKLFSANTEAENIVKAAMARARVMEEEARQNSAAATEAAAAAAAACEEYINEIRSAADSICRELDIELKNSAARISLLGKRIAAMDVSVPPALVTDSPAEAQPAAEPEKIMEEVNEETASEADTTEIPRYTQPETPTEEPKTEGGYFTKEYRQVMEELFGEGTDSPESTGEDDDTYDYLDKVSESKSVQKIKAVLIEDEEITDSNEVTDEYTGLSGGAEEEFHDAFTTDEIDRIFKSPSAEDIDDIMNEY